jgi:hypothetical protein
MRRATRLPALGILIAAALAASVGLVGCGERVTTAKKSAPPQAAASLGMPEILKAAADQADPMLDIFANEKRAAIYLAEIRQDTDGSPEKLEAGWHYAGELMKAGKVTEAIAEFERNRKVLATESPTKAREMAAKIMMAEALCYMRLGEDQNCCTGHSPHACLLPIRSTGIHQRKEGSLGAIRLLTSILKEEPKNLDARWLINVAYMTLGEYPAKVPAAWLIPPKVFQSDYDLKRFENIAPELELDFRGRAGGVIMDDFDGDGYLDLIVSTMATDGQIRYVHNNGDGTFTDRTSKSGLTGETGGLNIIQTDYNNDGNPDIFILRGGWMSKAGHIPNSLMRNNGDGTFTDVTQQAGLFSAKPTQTAVWLDYNGDGWLDVFIGNETDAPDNVNPCELFRNNHDGTFTDVAPDFGLDKAAFVKAVISADYDHNGRPDLYLSCQAARNILLRNDGPDGPDTSWKGHWTFTDVSHAAGVDTQAKAFSAIFFDYDNDGWPDIYVNGYGIKTVGDVAADYLGLPNNAERARLYHNDRDGTFSDVTRAAHLYKVNQGMGINFGDLDNDGWLDFYVGTGNPDFSTLIPKRMFRNAGGKFFQEVTTSGDFGHLQKGHGIAFGDIDNSGRQDIFAVLGGAYEGDVARCALFKNPGFGNHWINLKLEGVRSNRAAIGAQIKLTVATVSGDRTLYKTVNSGGSFGANPLRQEIGLGKATVIKSAEIFWPTTGLTQAVTGLQVDRYYHVREGDESAQQLAYRSFKLPSEVDGDHTQMLASAAAR